MRPWRVVALAAVVAIVVAVSVIVVMTTVLDEDDENPVPVTRKTSLIEPRLRFGDPGGDPLQVEVAATQTAAGPLQPNRLWMWRLLDSVNRWRVAHDQRPIKLNHIATKHADNHSLEMADQQDLHHSSFGLMPGYVSQGETVGRGGGDPYDIQFAFMASPEHKRVILLPEYNNIGISAVQDNDGTWWVTYILGKSVF